MFARILFLVLLAANVGVGLWLWRAHEAAPTTWPRADPGVASLVLLVEREAPDPVASAAELTSAPDAVDGIAAGQCASIGPFIADSDARRAQDALTPLVDRLRLRREAERASRGWSVFLPAPASRNEALRVARALQQSGVRDYYVVTAGPQQNTISLGLFASRENAERRLEEVLALGYQPAITERIDERSVTWIDFAPPIGRTFDWRNVLTDRSALGERPVPCF